MIVERLQILKLYKEIMRYGQQLKYTDKDYFVRRVKKEFQSNKNLKVDKEIKFYYEVCSIHKILHNE